MVEAVFARFRALCGAACAGFVLCGLAQSGVSAQGAATPPATAGKGAAPPIAPAVPPAIRAVAAQFDRAVKLQKSGQVDAAIAAYHEVLKALPGARVAPGAALPVYRNLLVLYRTKNDMAQVEATLKKVCALNPGEAAAWAELSTLAAGRRDYGEARRDAERALKLKPTPTVAAAAHFALGSVAVSAGHFEQADTEYSTAIRLAPSNIGAHYNRALALGSLKKFAQAQDELNTVKRLAPKMLEARLLAANLHIQARDPAGAVAAFDEVLAIDPHNRAALFSRALTLQRMGKINEAITAYLADLAVSPQAIDAQLNLAVLYASLHNLMAAHDHLLQAERLVEQLGRHDPRVLELLGESEAQLAINTGAPARRDAWVRQATDHLQQATRLNPDESRPMYELADLYRRTARYAEAIALYKSRLERVPDEKKAVYGLGDVYVMQQRAMDALTLWRDYEAHHPKDPEGYQQVAHLLELQGQWADAAREQARLVASDPLDGSALLAEANDLMQAGQAAQAGVLYRKLFAYDATASDLPVSERTVARANREGWRLAAWRGLAQIEEGQGNFKGAIDDLESVKADELAEARRNRAQPNHDVYIRIAGLYERDKRPDMAIKELTTLTQVADDDPVGYAELGRLYERQGDTDAAVAALRKASQREKDPVAYAIEGAELYRKHGKLDASIGEYEALRQKLPKDPRALAPLAQALEAARLYDRALGVYADLHRADPTLAWVEDRQAVVLTILKRYDEARAIREQEVAHNPGSAQAYADLAHIYELQGRSADYLAWLQPRVERSPDDPTLLEALLAAYADEKQPDAGWTALKAMADRHTSDVKVLKAYATVLQRNGRTADYVSATRRIATLSPNDIAAQVEAADALMANGQKAEALAVFKTQIARADLTTAQRLELRRYYAQRLQAQGDVAELTGVYRAILADDPEDAQALTSLVSTLSVAGRYDELVAACTDQLKRPGVPPAMRARLMSCIGAAYEKQNKAAAALAQYRDALKASPDDPVAKEAVKRLGG